MGKLHCWPGDMAKIVQPHFRHGAIVSVIRACSDAELDDLVALDPEWAACGHIWLCNMTTGSRGVDNATGTAAYLLPGDEAWVADKYLRPIRDSGEGAQDESTERLPAPALATA